jgi:hypothetical protein
MDHKTYKVSSERAIENLIAQYSHFLDAGDFKGVAEMFRYGKITYGDIVDEGIENVERHLHENLFIYKDGTPQKAHITTNTLLNINNDGNSATASSYVTIFQQDTEGSFQLQATMIGRYEDTFACIDGVWYFKVRSLNLKLTGDTSRHTIANRQQIL